MVGGDCQEMEGGDSDDTPCCVVCIVTRRSSSVSRLSIIYCGRLDHGSPNLGSEPNMAKYGEHLILAW